MLRSQYVAQLAIVIACVALLSGISMGTDAMLASQNNGSLNSLPSHFRWGTNGYVSTAQYYTSRNAVGNISGINRAELRSQDIATSNVSGIGAGIGIIDVFAVPNASIAYTGLDYVSGSRLPGPGQVIVVENSGRASLLHIGQVIQVNFTFLVAQNMHRSLLRSLTVAGFASSTLDGFGYLTNSELSGPVKGNMFDLTTLVANWDDLIPSMLDFVNSNQAETFFTEIFAYVKPSDYTGLDVVDRLAKAESFESQMIAATSQYGGSTDSWLIGQLQSDAEQYSGILFFAAVLILILCLPVTSYVTRQTMRKSRLDRHSQNGVTEKQASSSWDSGVDLFFLKALVVESGGVLITILGCILVVSLLTPPAPFSLIPSFALSLYSIVFGVGLSIAVAAWACQTIVDLTHEQSAPSEIVGHQ